MIEERMRAWAQATRTPELPGIGGEIKRSPEDFVVEEVPSYEPEGQGDHLFLWVEKRGASSMWAQKKIAAHLGIQTRDLGVAGIKDRHAVTRQWMSVPAPQGDVEAWVGPVPGTEETVEILRAVRHPKKLRRGHLKGNRFEMVFRGASVETPEVARERLEAIMEVLTTDGMLHLFDAQRFGRGGETLSMGLEMLRGGKRRRRVARNLERLALSAAQSAMFNDMLLARRDGVGFGRVLAGDVVQRRETGGVFVVAEDEVAQTQHRMDSGELVVRGPIFGAKMRRAGAEPGALEEEVLERWGVTWERLQALSRKMPGTRRPYLVWPEDMAITAGEEAGEIWARAQFFLPSGAYATILGRECTKIIPG